jgi:uncharacterized protein
MTRASQMGLIPPIEDLDSAGWWRQFNAGNFVVPRCDACRDYFFPPLPTCPACGSDRVDLAEASGHGSIYSWVTVHRALSPEFDMDVPYTIVAVDLDEGPRLFGRLMTGTPRADCRVQVKIYSVNGQRLISFRHVDGQSATP